MGHIGIGSRVELQDPETGQVVEFMLVPPVESDVKQSRISVAAPLAQALLAHEVGDEITLRVPGGMRTYEIVRVDAP
jgi:transcription elongation factor GreA